MLFTDEVKGMDELILKLGETDQDFGKIKVAAVGFIFDKNNQLILNRRGPGARDEVGMLQAIGGSVNKSDQDFRQALLRELKEEAGVNAEYKIGEFLGAQLDGKTDRDSGEYINWIILGYKVFLVSGEVENMEPDRSIGFERGNLDSFDESEVSVVAYNFISMMRES